MDYHSFLQSKMKRFTGEGFACESSLLPTDMFEWQRKIVEWACKKGRCALWADTGLGKTIMQLAWADQVVRQTGQSVLILTPLAVSSQTVKEALRFGVQATIAHAHEDIMGPGIYVTNYQKLHRFDASVFAGVVLDESSILKSFQGKTKTLLTETFAQTPYRLACTATPAPNDHLELGNHADFLGIMPQKEMLARWFLNDIMGNMTWRLKTHAVKDFWRWVASWALVLRSPADLGYASAGYDLPALTVHHITIPTTGIHLDGMLFPDASLSATTLHTVLRQTAPIRAKKAAEIVEGLKGASVLLWTHTNYEADELMPLLPAHTIEVRGSDDDIHKESAANWFTGLPISPEYGLINRKWKKIISRTTTDLTETNEYSNPLNGSKRIAHVDDPTCAATLKNTPNELLHNGEPWQTHATSGDVSNISPTSPCALKPGNAPKHGKPRIQRSDLRNDLNPMASLHRDTGQSSHDKMVDAPSVAYQTRQTSLSDQRMESDDCTLITATLMDESEDCSVQPAILDLGSSVIPCSSSNGHSSTSNKKILLSKSSIFGFGMNFQSCTDMIFVGMDYSYEKFYQAVRRCWRYGQQHEVNAYLLCTDMEWRLFDSLAKKQAAHTTMQDEMIAMMKEEYAELTSARRRD